MTTPKAWPHPMDANVEPPAKATEAPDRLIWRGAQVLGVDHPDLVIEVDHAEGPDETVVYAFSACEVFVDGVSLGTMDGTFSYNPAPLPTFDEIARANRNARKAARRRR